MTESERALQFAKTYVSLVEALQQAGCTEELARSEARMAAMVHLTMLDQDADDAKKRCPVCGS